MLLNTKRFGDIEISDDRIITFKEGIPGFEHLRSFIVILLDQTKPFFWLQSVEEDISLPVISPFDVNADYSPMIDDSIFDELGIEKEDDLLVLNVAIIPDDMTKMTVNLVAPILINVAKNLGKQIIIEGGEYQMRYLVYDTVMKLIKEV